MPVKGPLLVVPDEHLMSPLQHLQESPLELELEEMMGKPVHTLSVDDDSETSDSTVLGPKLTDNQINRLGDIFEDRRASSFLFLSPYTDADQAVHFHDSRSLPACPSVPTLCIFTQSASMHTCTAAEDACDSPVRRIERQAPCHFAELASTDSLVSSMQSGGGDAEFSNERVSSSTFPW